MIYVINRYQKKNKNVKEFSGYEQLIKFSDKFSEIPTVEWISKLANNVIARKPKNYISPTYSKELIAFCYALITGQPLFYLYADKDAFLAPWLKKKLKLKRIKIYGTLHWPNGVNSKFSFYKYHFDEVFNGIITLSENSALQLNTTRKVIYHGINLDYWKNNNVALNNDSFYLILGKSNRDHFGQIKIIKEILKINPLATFKVLISDE